jgi:hypothetical protein
LGGNVITAELIILHNGVQVLMVLKPSVMHVGLGISLADLCLNTALQIAQLFAVKFILIPTGKYWR